MENNELETGVQTPNVPDTNSGAIDYKAEYEKMKRLKDQYSKESSDWKNKYNSTLSEAEKSKIAMEEREAYYKGIEREYNLGRITNGLSKSIANEDVVKNIASKMLEGDNISAIKELNKYLETHDAEVEKRITEKLLRDNPTPPASNETGVKDLKYYMSSEKGMIELNQLRESNPNEYNRILKGKK